MTLKLVEDLCTVERRYLIGGREPSCLPDVEERHERGERQRYCSTCGRHPWPDHRAGCPSFVDGGEP
jgi:hypothetical protein